MVRPNIIDMNPVELKYYQFMISLDKYAGSWSVLSPKICLAKERKSINAKAFDMLTTKNEAKTMAKHISCNHKCKFNSAACNSNQKWNNKTCQCECKNYRKCKEDYSWNLAHVFVRIANVSKKYCWYLSNRVWWNHNCYGYCVKKKKANIIAT